MGKAYNNFAELMANIFQPMFEATLHPSKHPEIYTLLAHIGGKSIQKRRCEQMEFVIIIVSLY